MKRIIATVLCLTMILGLAACGSSSSSAAPSGDAAGSSAPPKAEAKFWTFAAPPSSSALYPYWVSLGECIATVYPEYKITVSDSQGAVAITKSVRNGEADIGNSVSATDYENYNGQGTFEGDPNPDARMLFYYETTAEMFCVTQESGITSLSDLAGKKFNPGGTGGSAEDLCKKILALFNVEPNYFTASQSDAADAYSNKEIVGTVKLGPTVDSYVMQLNAASKVNIISMSDEEVDTILKAYPYLIKVVIPAGTYDSIDHDVVTVGTPQGAQTTAALSQEDGYKVCKAVFEDGKSIWQAAYPTGADNDYFALTLASSIPLHAGTVQFLTEKGYDVPEGLIPTEYVPAA